MENRESMSAVATIRFTDEVNELPLPYVNACSVQSGVDDFFVTVGAVVPPEIKSEEDLKKYSEIVAKPLFRFALSRSSIEQLMTTLYEQYQNQTRHLAEDKEIRNE
jgi:hypothetical protein